MRKLILGFGLLLASGCSGAVGPGRYLVYYADSNSGVAWDSRTDDPAQAERLLLSACKQAGPRTPFLCEYFYARTEAGVSPADTLKRGGVVNFNDSANGFAVGLVTPNE